MKKPLLILLPLLILASCGDTQDNKNTFSKEDYDNLLGTYYGSGSELSLNTDSLSVSGDINLSLKPSEIKSEKIFDQTEKIIYYSSSENSDKYRLYLGGEKEELTLQLEKFDSSLNSYEKYASFMPSIEEFSGAYTNYDFNDEYHDDIYSIKYIFSSIYNSTYDNFYAGVSSATFSASNAYYLKSFYKYEDNERIKYVSLYDYADNYLFDSYKIVDSGNKYYLTAENSDFYPDSSFAQGTFFNSNNMTNEVVFNKDDAQISINNQSFHYTQVMDENGNYLEITLNGEETKVIPTPFGMYLQTENGDIELVYDSTTALQGSFQYKDLKYEFDGTNLTLNGNNAEYEYIIKDHQKSIKSSLNNQSLIFVPDKSNVSISFYKGDEKNYLINYDAFSSYFAGDFIYHSENELDEISISTDFEINYHNKTYQADLIYNPKENYPYLSFSYEQNEVLFKIVDLNIKAYNLIKSGVSATFFEANTIKSLYNNYVSQAAVDLILDENNITIDNQKYTYKLDFYYNTFSFSNELALYYNNNSSLYQVRFNLYGNADLYKYSKDKSTYEYTKSYILKDEFDKTVGAYYFDGTYGPEKFKLTSDGHFYADTLNEDKNGLTYDVEMPYILNIIHDQYDNPQVVITFIYQDAQIYLYKSGYHLTSFGNNYILDSFYNFNGIYTYGNEDVIQIIDDTIYINGSSATINEVGKFENNSTYYDVTDSSYNNYKINASIDESGNKTLSYEKDQVTKSATELDPSSLSFEGDYINGEKTYSITRNLLSKRETDRYTISINDIDYTAYNFVFYNGFLALKVAVFSDTYYFYIDSDGTKTVTVESLLPPPPLPPAL